MLPPNVIRHLTNDALVWLQKSRDQAPLGELIRHAASFGAETCLIALLTEEGARDAVNEPAEVELHTALHSAKTGAIATLLLQAGADRESRDHSGRSPLHPAAAAGHADVVRVLLAAGASVDATDAEGRTPLMRARDGGHEQVVAALLAAGANPNPVDPTVRVPLEKRRLGAETKTSEAGRGKAKPSKVEPGKAKPSKSKTAGTRKRKTGR